MRSRLALKFDYESLLLGFPKLEALRIAAGKYFGVHYLMTGKLPEYRQGLHSKSKSIITNEEVQATFKMHIRDMTNLERTPRRFAKELNETYLKTFANAPSHVSEESARRWLQFLGFHSVKQAKGYYTDEHNREDIVRYRDVVVFLPRMAETYKFSNIYSGDNMELVTPP